ncbi:DNA cytosine methyltransferase [Alcaligenaceae bacterium B3P038]|nr:DNA cytosine methyltransferase [Alcaligenaceae bacterium B3P038]
MIRDQFTLDVHNELIIDNFAGGGGASTGIEMALGRCVDVAINHDPEAVQMHAINHPQTKHYCESVWDVDPLEVTQGRPVGLAWFSPDCKHFSKAKGGKPVEKKIRGLAWIVLRWAALVRPRVIMLENVEEFKTWGPLMAKEVPQLAPDGSVESVNVEYFPDPARRGETFRSFIRQLQEKGYAVETRELRACDYGTPTIRKRLFMIARCDGQPIVWPAPTHGAPTSPGVLAGLLKPWRTAAECIDWSLACPSIFERKRPLAEATMKRIARGIQRYVIDNADPFIVKVNHSGDDFRGQTSDAPMQTITSKHGTGIVAPHITKFRTGSTGVDMREPMPTITAGPKENPAGAPHALGVVSPYLVGAGGPEYAGKPKAVDTPFNTLTTENHSHVVAPYLTPYHAATSAGGDRVRSLQDPLATQTTENRFAVVAPTLVQTGYGERAGQAPRAPGLDKPLGTVVAGGAKHALVAGFLAKHFGGHYDGPGASLDAPTHTVTAVDHHALVTAQLVGCGGRAGQSRPRDANEPVQTITAKGDTAIVASHLAKLRETSSSAATNEPLHTVSAGGTHHADVRAFLVKYYGEGGQDQDARDPMHTIPTKDRLGLVTVAGEQYVIADIGMRMLEPHELYAAQGFPSSYVIAPTINGRRLPKHAQVRMCGNSVCPPLAAALARANVADMAAWTPKEAKTQAIAA